MTINQVTAPDVLPSVMKKLPFKTLDELYAAIGYGGFTALKAVNRIREEFALQTKAAAAEKAAAEAAEKSSKEDFKPTLKRTRSENGIIVEGLDNCLVKFSKCCTPVPGDDIIGFITRGYGVSVHRKDCPNTNLNRYSEEDRNRWIKVSWGENVRESYPTSLEVVCKDRLSLLADISTALSTSKVNLTGFNGSSTSDGFAIFYLTINVANSVQLEQVMRKLHQVSGVMKVTRSAG